MVITATIPLLEHNAQEHDRTAVSLGFLGHLSLSIISIMGVLFCYYHLFSQNFTSRHDNTDKRAIGLILAQKLARYSRVSSLSEYKSYSSSIGSRAFMTKYKEMKQFTKKIEEVQEEAKVVLAKAQKDIK